MDLFVVTIIGDFRGISGFFLLLATSNYGGGDISGSCSGATVSHFALSVALSWVSPSLLFFSGLFGLGLFWLVPLFGLIDLALALTLRGHGSFLLNLFRLFIASLFYLF